MFDTLLTLAATTEGADPGLLGTFGINGKVILAQIVNFGLVAFLLWKFAYKPVIATLDERQKKIADGLQFAEEARLRLTETEKKQAETLREAQTEAQKILEESRQNAKGFEERMRTETAAQIEEMRRHAHEANELERQKILSEVRQEIARLVVLTSAKVLQTELSDAERQRLSSAAAREISSSN